MNNHYHLLVETPEANLVAGMRRLNSVYTQSFNHRHDRVGHVLQGRYKSIVVDRNAYLLELCRYVTLNPVRAEIRKRPADWPWSSYRATAGLSKGPEWLAVDWVLSQFSRKVDGAQEAYRRFVAEGMQANSPWESLRGQIWLGNEEFLTRMQKQIKKGQIPDIPKTQRLPSRPTLKEIMQAVSGAYRLGEKDLRNRTDPKAYKTAVYLLRRVAGVGIREVGAIFGVSGSRISKIQRGIEDGEEIPKLNALLKKCKVKI